MRNGAKEVAHPALHFYGKAKTPSVPLVTDFLREIPWRYKHSALSADWLTYLVNWIKTGSGQRPSPPPLLFDIRHANPFQNNQKGVLMCVYVWSTTKLVVKITAVWVKWLPLLGGNGTSQQ